MALQAVNIRENWVKGIWELCTIYIFKSYREFGNLENSGNQITATTLDYTLPIPYECMHMYVV